MHNRNFGLDVIRASAILFVLVNHILNYFITFNRSTIFGDISGILGVEIFFVLSGFLIGRIIFKNFQPDMSFQTVKTFYVRRWFRTLPLYYVLLITFIIVAAIASKQFDFHPLHFVFLQNLFPSNFFSISWSLAIEEWFYLLVPLFLFFSFKVKLFTKKMLFIVLFLIISIISIRILYILLLNPTFEEIRKHVFLRFDSLLIGVFLASVKLHVPNMYKHFQKPIFPAIALILLLFVAYEFMRYYAQISLNPPFFVNALSLPLVSILIALLIPYFENSKLINTKIHNFVLLRNIIIWISLLSYSLYLIHLSMFDIVRGVFPPGTQLFIVVPAALTLAFIAAYLLYHFIEKPFMNMRERITKNTSHK